MNTNADVAEFGTIEYFDPNDIEVDENVRDDVKLDRAFLASIRDRGVLMPVACRRKDGKVSVRMGQRRVLAAREVGRVVPGYVVEGDDATVDRLLDQFAENEHRARLTENERAGVFKQLAFEGLSVPQIARKTGVKRAVIEAGLTVADSEFAGKIATKHEVTLDQAAAILDFEDDKEAVQSLVRCAEHSPAQFPHELQRQRDERHRREVQTQAETELSEQGFVILDRAPGYYEKTPVALSDLVDARTGDPVTVEQITGLSGAAAHVRVYVNGETNVGYYLDDPKAHGFKKRPQNGAATGPMTDEQKEERRQLIANNKAWASAEVVRREWLAGFLVRKTLPKDATQFVATMLTAYRHRIAGALTDSHGLAATFLGLTEPVSDWESPLGTFVQQQPGKAGHATLAVVLASIESTTSKETWRRPEAAAKCYFAQLAAWGYPLSEVEQIVVGTDATADDPTADTDEGATSATPAAEGEHSPAATEA